MKSLERQAPVMKDLGRITRRWLLDLGVGAGVSAGLVLAAGGARAQMVGGEVTHGQASVQQHATGTGTHTQIDTFTQHTRMKWDRHDIPVGDSVRIEQPNQNAAYLAQVSDASVTSIDGILSSNGQVWIANPAGVYFGGNAVVDVGRLVAGAGDVSQRDFVGGLQRFTDLRGEVRNDGQIHAQSGVSLIGRTVANHGQIVTRRGDIVMAAGDDVFITRFDTFIQVHMPGSSDGPAVENTGSLEARGRGRARLAAGDFLGLAIRNTGEIHARRIALSAGRDSIVSVGGSLDASRNEPGEFGGTIEIAADVILLDGANLDASGAAGGGEILIGGEAGGGTGAYGEVRNALASFVSEDSELRADATEEGDGGTVVVWSDARTVAKGALSARGGPMGGAGGFVETSSRGQLIVDADVDVSAKLGTPGTWLLDPVNVFIVEDPTSLLPDPIIDPDDVLTEVSIPFNSVFNFVPELDDGEIPQDSYVTPTSLVDALVRGASVVVTTEARFLTLTGDGVGDITVVDPIEILASDERIRPGAESRLSLVAANDVRVQADIRSDHPNLTLDLTLEANDNEITSPSGQREDESQLAVGDVVIDDGVSIRTNGGSVIARGINVFLKQGAEIDTRRIDRATGNGAFVSLIAQNPVFGDPNEPDMTIAGRIVTDGGSFFAAGTHFELTSDGSIESFGTAFNDPELLLGSVSLSFLEEAVIDGDIQGDLLSLNAGAGGEGDLLIGAGGDALSLSASVITLSAGDPSQFDPDQVDARVVIGDGVEIIDSGDAMAPTDPTKAPDELRLIQDRYIRDADLPDVGQFGGDSVAGMRYGLETRDGIDDPADPQNDFDIILSDAAKFAGADLALVVPDSFRLADPITATNQLAPQNFSLTVIQGFTVTADLASRILPVDASGEGGILRFHAGLDGEGDLAFEDGAVLDAPRIALRAGDIDPIDPASSGFGSTSRVLANAPSVEFKATESFEIRQDASITEENIPDASQMTGAFPDLDYILQSEGGSVTLSDETKVEGTDLVLTALLGIDLATVLPISVNSADLGGFSDFEVSEDLLSGIDIQPDGSDARILKLRSLTGELSFQSQTTDGSGLPLQVRVEADRISLFGNTIDVATGTPIFQKDELTSPERLVFTQIQPIRDGDLPTADNFPFDPSDPDRRGPSELFVIQSGSTVNLTQAGDGDRNWRFPVQDETQVILTAPQVLASRLDGSDLVLGPDDDFWGSSVALTAVLEGSGTPPISPAEIDTATMDAGSIRGFDGSIDFTDTNFDVPLDDDGTPLAVANFTFDQDAGFELMAGELQLPDFDDPDSPGSDLGLQPVNYTLVSRKGSFEVSNDQLADTHLSISVDTLGEIIDFDENSPLQVTSFVGLSRGSFEVGVNGGAEIEAEEKITLVADVFGSAPEGERLLSFAPDVLLTAEVVALQSSQPGVGGDSLVDARTNAPEFRIGSDGQFGILQNGAIRNGLDTPLAEIDYGQVPDPGQFRDAGGNPVSLIGRYRLESVDGDVAINDPSEVLLAREVELVAGSDQLTRTLTLRADTQTAVPCAAVCGTATDPNLVLIASGSGIESVELRAATILLDAPNGYVDAGDPRVVFEVLGPEPRLAIRQQDPIGPSDAEHLPERLQVLVGFDSTPYEVQSLGRDPSLPSTPGDPAAISVGEEFAERVENSNLILTGGLTQDEFDAALGSTRGEEADPTDPEAPVYDRYVDLDGNGVVDDQDQDLFDDLAAQIAIEDPGNPFTLVLRSLDIRSRPGDERPIRMGNVTIQSESDQIYQDEVQIVGDAVLTAQAGILEQLTALFTAPASSIVFEEEVYGLDPGQNSLTVQATNRVRFARDIGTHDDPNDSPDLGELRLGTLKIDLKQLIQLEAVPPTPRAEFGTVDLAGELRVAANEVLLNVTSGDADSTFARRQIPDAATFFRQGGSLRFDLGSGGSLTMGQNEKLSVDGPNLIISAPGGTVSVGDLAALDLIDIDADTIHLRRRQGSQVVRANGNSIKDAGVDYVAKTILFHVLHDADVLHDSDSLYHNQIGGGRDARFGVAKPLAAPAFMDNFSVTSLQFNILTGAGLEFGGGDLPIDGIPDGISRATIAETYADDRPGIAMAVPAAYRVRDPESLRAVGIDMRLPTPTELRAAAKGAAVFTDLASLERGVSGEASLRVAEVRLVAQEIERSVALHAKLFAPDGSRAPHVRDVLQRAIDDYRRSTGARRIVGFELRRYVYNRPSSQFEAYQELQRLDSLFRHHRRSGLTPTEYRAIQKQWLQSIQPEGITLHELSEFIHPSRYVRGSDVLDVFGD